MEILTEYTFIGEDQDGSEDLMSAEPGRVTVVRQALYMQDVKDWSKGDRVGTLHGSLIVGRGKVICHFVFDLEDGHAIVVGGALPPGESNFGEGVLAVTGGTGQFAKAAGVCVVETMNPKRYLLGL